MPRRSEDVEIHLESDDAGGQWRVVADEYRTRFPSNETYGPPPRRKGLVAAVLIVLLVAGLVGLARRHGREQVAVGPAPAPAPTPVTLSHDVGTTAVLTREPGTPRDIALDGSLFVLYEHPPKLVAATANGNQVGARATVAFGSDAVIADHDTHRLWVLGPPTSVKALPAPENSVGLGYVGPAPVTTVATPLDEQTLLAAGTPIQIPGDRSVATAAKGALWLGGNAGLTRATPDGHIASVMRLPGPVTALATDWARNRILVAAGRLAGTDVYAVDLDTGVVLDRGHLPLVDVSLAATVAGAWYAGATNPGEDGQIGRFNASSVSPRTDLSQALSTRLAVGGRPTLFGGQGVIWVRRAGSEPTSCIAAKDGTELGRWASALGPVVSSSYGAVGLAGGPANPMYGIRAPETVVRRLLRIPACPG